jgi:Phage portal protein, SPP1 Gp6-like
MFDTICDLIPRDRDYPERTRKLDILSRVLEGRLYDVLPYRFHEERGASGEYIPLRNRRPSIRYPLSRIVVEDSVALLFSEGHFPTIDCSDPTTEAAIAEIASEAQLNLVMTDAAIRGSVGSTAILLRVLKGRVFLQVLNTMYMTPFWAPDEPDTLKLVVEKYKVPGRVFQHNGYADVDVSRDYWFERHWDASSETWFQPRPVGTDEPPAVDSARTTRHGLGFVPLVWIKNLPGISSTGDPVDGACTFRSAIETQIEIDYQLSQAGRGLKYSSDPTLLLKEPAAVNSELLTGAGNALVVGEHGDARLLEIGGTASAAVMEYVRTLREFALESVHGNRASPERLSAAQSGRALELMNQGLIWLADNLRTTYGEGAILRLARMIARASTRYALRVHGRPVPPMDPEAVFSLKWPRWYPVSAEDRQRDAQTLATLTKNGHISRETAVKSIADVYDIADVSAELVRIENDYKSSDEPCQT